MLLIKTPEGVVFSQHLAGPATRMAAWSVDFACVLALVMVLNLITSLSSLISPDFAQALMILNYFAVSIGYGIFTEWHWRGQTIGKRLMRLRVVDAQGLQLHFSQIVIRNLLRFVDALPLLYLTGGLVCLLSRRAQRLGDLAANTVVVRLPRIFEPDLKNLLGGKFNSLRLYPHLVARLRQRVAPDEAAAALQAVMRRDEFLPDARVELFRCLAAHFAELVPFPADAMTGITDEQYIRNVVDVLFRTQARKEPAAPPSQATAAVAKSELSVTTVP